MVSDDRPKLPKQIFEPRLILFHQTLLHCKSKILRRRDAVPAFVPTLRGVLGIRPPKIRPQPKVEKPPQLVGPDRGEKRLWVGTLPSRLRIALYGNGCSKAINSATFFEDCN